jgi:4-alpha-glucanotransferase
MNSELNRQSGILLHLTSLPGPHGIGDLGQGAYSFVDSMKEMGQHLWQILPANPPENLYHCPYSASSAFAGNTLLISLEALQKDGFLESLDLADFPQCAKDRVEFDKVNPARRAILQKAADRFPKKATTAILTEFNDFCTQNQNWLDHYAMYCHLAEKYNHINWTQWSAPLRFCDPKAIQAEFDRHQQEINRIKILQYFFYRQWQNLKKYANNKGVRIIGDIPIYVAHDSADVWGNQELFKLDEAGHMTVQSGCPPDFFKETGQLWGHPIYDWTAHESTQFSWWIARISYIYKMVDIIRIDHFNGFAKYWEVPAMDKNGLNGYWMQAPGEKLLDTLTKELGMQPILAENLGEAAPDAEPLLKKFGIPGMKILQMSVGNDYNPAEMDSSNVVYTGTHDNDTTVGWFHTGTGQANLHTEGEIDWERKQALAILGSNGSEIHWDMIKLALNSPADTAIIPLQDILGLGSTARMNTPGTVGQNWEWRFDPDLLTPGLKERLLNLTTAAGRA